MSRWMEFLPDEVRSGLRPMNEDDVWQAIADANDMDYSEIADGDLVEWL